MLLLVTLLVWVHVTYGDLCCSTVRCVLFGRGNYYLIEKYQFLSVVPCVRWQTQTCAWFYCSCLWFQEKYSCHYKQAIYLFVLPVINGQGSGFDCSYRRHSPILVIPSTAHFHCLQVWYLIVSIPDLGTLTYFVYSSNFIRLSDLALDDNKTCAPSSSSLALEFIDPKPLVLISKSDISFSSVDIFLNASLVILQKYL